MTSISTAYGEGRIVATENYGLGKKRYRVAGVGFDVWMDSAEISKIASNPRDRAGDSWAESRDKGRAEHGRQDLDDEYPAEIQDPDFFYDHSEEVGGHPNPDLFAKSAGFGEHGWEDDEEDDKPLFPEYLDRPGLEDTLEAMGHDHANGGRTKWTDHNHHAAFEDTDPSRPEWGDDEWHEGLPSGGYDMAIHHMDQHYAAKSFDFEPSNHTWDNHTTLPYNWRPQFPVEMFRDEQTISPDHEIDAQERLHSSDSRSGENREEDHPWPGPAKHLFAAYEDPFNSPSTGHRPPSPEDYANQQAARSEYDGPSPHDEPHYEQHLEDGAREHESDEKALNAGWRPHSAGLDSRYADIMPIVAHNDPVWQFRNDPYAAIERQGAIDLSAGLDHETGLDQVDHVRYATKQLKEAKWRDVAQKAYRLKREGHVHVHAMDPSAIYATVAGDHGDYEVMILRGSAYSGLSPTGHKKQAIANWKCSCDWGKWAFKRKFTFVGRLCSHGYAAYLTQQGEHMTDKYRRRKTAADDDSSKDSSLSGFKKFIKEDNDGHIDFDAADLYLQSLEDEPDKADAEKIYEYVLDHHTEHEERDYDVKGYHYDNDGVLQNRPGHLNPHSIEVPELSDEDHHYFTDLSDNRKTTGPEQIMAKMAHAWDVGRELIARGEDKIHEHHPAFAWSTDPQTSPGGPDADQKIQHFSSLTFTADENLLQKLRDLSQEPPDLGNMADHNMEVRNTVEELRERGFDASPMVASLHRQAMWKRADLDDGKDDMAGPVDFNNLNSPAAPVAQHGPGYVDPSTFSGGGGAHGPGWVDPNSYSGGGGQTPPAQAHTDMTGVETLGGSPSGAPAAAAEAGAVRPAPTPGQTSGTGPAGTPMKAAPAAGGANTEVSGMAPGADVPFAQRDPASQKADAAMATLGKPAAPAPKPGGMSGADEGAMGIPQALQAPGGGNTGLSGSSGKAPGSLSSGNEKALGLGAPMGGPTLPKISAADFALRYFAADGESSDGESEKKNEDDGQTSAPSLPSNVTNPPNPTGGGADPNKGNAYASPTGHPGTQPGNPSWAAQHPGRSEVGPGAGPAANPGALNSLAPPVAGAPTGPIGPGGTGNDNPGGKPPPAPGVPGVPGMGMGGNPLLNALGLGHLGSAEHFASQYFTADNSLRSVDGGDWMDYPFAGSGPLRKDFSTTSEQYVEQNERTNRHDNWAIDQDGDLIKDWKPAQRPKQSSRRYADAGTGNAGYGNPGPMPGGAVVPAPQGEGGSVEPAAGGMGATPTMGDLSGMSTASRNFWADVEMTAGPHANSPTGYFGHGLHPGPAYDKGETGLGEEFDQQQQQQEEQGGHHGGPHIPGLEGGAEEGEGLAGAAEELAPLAMAASRYDGSDIVRQFQASGGGALAAGGDGGQFGDAAIAKQAQRLLKTAGRHYSLAEQRALEEETHPGGARNLGSLDLSGTHYEG